jgi:hypothetical protein
MRQTFYGFSENSREAAKPIAQYFLLRPEEPPPFLVVPPGEFPSIFLRDCGLHPFFPNLARDGNNKQRGQNYGKDRGPDAASNAEGFPNPRHFEKLFGLRQIRGKCLVIPVLPKRGQDKFAQHDIFIHIFCPLIDAIVVSRLTYRDNVHSTPALFGDLCFKEIVAGVNESSRLVGEIALSSDEQSAGIARVNTGIDQVAQVVEQNSATAEENAAASEEMSAQSDTLESLVAQFKLKDDGSSRHRSRSPEGGIAPCKGGK